jgi:hypothetical protein
MLLRRATLLLCVAVSATACGAAAGQADGTTPALEIGALPPVVTTVPATASSSVRGSTTTLALEDRVGAKAQGNRIILIGDSVMASTSRRYSNDMCEALVPLGWQVEVDAETGRFTDFGLKVLDKRLDAGWDVGVILLGNNYSDNKDRYRQDMEEMVQQLSPKPVVLITVTEFKPSRADVNDVIRELADAHDNVMVVDWAAITRDNGDFTGADGLHLTTVGREALAANVALALGEAPEQPGDCLRTSFADDSRGPVTGSTVRTNRTTTTSGGGSGNTDPAPPPDSTSQVTDPTVPVTVPEPTPTTTPPTSPAASVPPDTTPPAG